ncbi:ABC transporter ATP-binding protein [Sediminispirochaeta bajacaliforniensis]|uniref:ABC transporter ATP-binding protein n=1 Tax=Sediminispirochaeta bajacaliforniensis TaxID=148 RepID=UPI00039D4B6F|nr:ABC transporter ATP-binding protein [Sediminispirochaeta bajacaliforniensis]
MMILEARDIGFRYHAEAKPVLSDLSMGVEKGSITAILGPNGAGKSTLLDLCLGWKQPSRGSMLLQGRPIGSYSRREAGQLISLVPQDERISFGYSVIEYALLGRAPYLEQLEMPGIKDRAIAEHALEKTGIAKLKQRPVTSLSGGEYQLLMIARALSQEPSIMLLDEPTSKLDLANQRRVSTILASLSQSGVTILFTTHHPALAAAIATHLVLLKEGLLLEAGPTEQILTGRNLSRLYDVPIHVRSVEGKPVIIQE